MWVVGRWIGVLQGGRDRVVLIWVSGGALSIWGLLGVKRLLRCALGRWLVVVVLG